MSILSKFKDKMNDAQAEAQQFMAMQMMEKVLPMAKSFAPRAEAMLKDYLSGKNEDPEQPATPKLVVLEIGADGVTKVKVFAKQHVSVTVKDASVDVPKEEIILGAHSVDDLIESFTSGALEKMLG